MLHDIIASVALLFPSTSSVSFGEASFGVDSTFEDVYAGDEAREVLVVSIVGVVSKFGGEDHSWLHVVVVLRHGTVSVDLYLADAHFCCEAIYETTLLWGCPVPLD